MHKQISNNQILSRQASYEEKFAVQVLIRNARKVITHAFALWLQRVEECKEEEVYALQAAGNAKIEVLSS